MDEVMRAVEAEIRADPRRARSCWRPSGGGFPRRRQPGGRLRAHRAARGADLLARPPAARRLSACDPWRAFRATTPSARSCRRSATPSEVLRPAHLGAQLSVLQHRRRQLRDRLRPPRARPGDALRVRASSCASRLRRAGGIVDADTTLKLDKPELRVEIDRARAADLGVDTEDIAEALRLMVGGDEEVSRFRDPSVNDDYDVAAAADDRKAGTTRTRSRGSTCRAAAAASCGWTASCRSSRAQTASRIDRLDRQRQVSLRASGRAGLRAQPTASRRCGPRWPR